MKTRRTLPWIFLAAAGLLVLLAAWSVPTATRDAREAIDVHGDLAAALEASRRLEIARGTSEADIATARLLAEGYATRSSQDLVMRAFREEAAALACAANPLQIRSLPPQEPDDYTRLYVYLLQFEAPPPCYAAVLDRLTARGSGWHLVELERLGKNVTAHLRALRTPLYPEIPALPKDVPELGRAAREVAATLDAAPEVVREPSGAMAALLAWPRIRNWLPGARRVLFGAAGKELDAVARSVQSYEAARENLLKLKAASEAAEAARPDPVAPVLQALPQPPPEGDRLGWEASQRAWKTLPPAPPVASVP